VRPALLALLALAVIVGCGHDDRADARQTVRDFVRATNDRDGDAFCDQLVTADFLHRTTGRTGEAAERECKAELKSYRGVDVQLLRIGRTRVRGSRATVAVTLRSQGQTQVRVLRLERQGGRFRLAGG
jgi:hypothetical protein